MFDSEHTGRQRRFCVIRPYLDCLLQDERPRIHFRHDEVYRRAVPFHFRLERAAVGVEALELRQQGWMDVEHAALPFADEIAGEDSHETGEADDLDPVFL